MATDFEVLSTNPPGTVTDVMDDYAAAHDGKRKTAQQIKDDLIGRWRDRVLLVGANCPAMSEEEATRIITESLTVRNNEKLHAAMHLWDHNRFRDEVVERRIAEKGEQVRKEDMDKLHDTFNGSQAAHERMFNQLLDPLKAAVAAVEGVRATMDVLVARLPAPEEK